MNTNTANDSAKHVNKSNNTEAVDSMTAIRH